MPSPDHLRRSGFCTLPLEITHAVHRAFHKHGKSLVHTRVPHSSCHMSINTARDAVGDVNALKRLERFGGPRLRAEISSLFLQEAPSRIASARAALAGGNIEGVRSVGHLLKSCAGQMGVVGFLF